ncbi:DUF3367 domain-containing protein [Allobranchiibius sp. CTAmp26]|nr:DUF3367 domain-containing protein [Allobranchiibius sp. CTAmp26]
MDRVTREQPDGALPDRARVVRVLAVLAMALLPWLVAPGQVQPDTKIDLTLSPWTYLARSVDAWNGHAGLGELQNQAYGYLFPMGPVFGIGHSLGLPAWACQRVWWTILLLVAFLGVARLVRELRLAGPSVALLAAAAYALCPRVLTLLAENSSEAWPMAVAPWLVLAARPLVRADLDRRGVLRAVAVGGLLAAALGGVNAAASGLMLVVPFLFLITHPRGRRRIGWWAVGVLAGASWWLLPLLVLGGYGYPFLDFIETASMTTAVTSTPNVLRGDSDWIAYILDSAGHPTWQAGWTSAQSLVSILATSAVAGVGLVGVARLRSHLGRFAVLSVLVGTVFMTVGHHGVVGSPVAVQVRALLDGSLAPLRNVHKADALIRLPVVLGLAVVLDRLRRSREVAARLVAAALVVLVAAAMTPIWQGRLADSGGYRAVPASWSAMAHRIDAAAERAGGSTLLFPNARTATYDWGTTSDDPMSALAASPLVFRAAAPLGEPGATRMLDTADQLAASGQVQPGLAAGLARMGIARVVVRHSIASTVGAQPWSLVEATLRRSPGFAYAGSTGTGTGTDRLTLWTVGGSQTVAAYPQGHDLRVVGGPESVFDLSTVGALSPNDWTQVVGGTTGAGGAVPDVVTDSLRWRSYNNGVSATDGYSPTLTRDDTTPDHIGARDLPPGGDPASQPVRALIGMTSWSASSSGADPTAATYAGPGAGIAAAFDDDPATAWRTGDHEATASLSFTPSARTPLREVDVDLASGPGLDRIGSLRLSVGAVRGPTVQVARGQTAVRLQLPRAATGTVRVELHVAGVPTDPVMGLTGVSVPGQRLGSVIALPGRVDPTRTSVLLRRDPRERSTAAAQGEDPALLARRVTFSRSGPVAPSVWVRSEGGHAGGLQLACGAAGVLHVGTTSVPLRLTASAAQIAQGALLHAAPCTTSAAVAAGPQTVSVTPGSGVRAELVYLQPRSAAGVGTATDRTSVSARASGALRSGDGTVRVDGGGTRVVALTEGYNRGWHASLAGRSLPTVRVDGWRQGFVVPPGPAATVHVTFGPTRWQRAGLLVGALAVLALAALAVATRRRTRRVPAHEIDPTDVENETGGGVVVAAVLSVGVGVLMSGPAGAVVGVLCMLVPRRLLGWGIGGSMALAGVLLAGLGVVDQRSAGAILGQLAGTVTACLLARCPPRRRTGSADGPAPAPDAPPGSPTSSPPPPTAPSPRPASS